MGRKSKRVVTGKYTVGIKRRKEDFTDPETESGGNQDVYQLLTILPEEVWLMIFTDKIGAKSKTGTDSLTSCSLASPYFRKLLDDQRKLFLFPKVLGSLTRWLDNEKKKSTSVNDSSSSDDSDDDETEGSSSNSEDGETERSSSNSVFKLTNILKCREVCPEWNKAIVDFYQDTKRYTAIRHDQGELTRNLGGIKMCIRENNIARHPASFLEHFERTHGGDEVSTKRNPFPGRSIKLKNVLTGTTVPIRRRHQIIREGVVRILEKYGDNLWHCEIDLQNENFTNRIDFYQRFRQLLSLMPNLKTFKLDCSHVFRRDPFREFHETLDELQEYIARNPLPKLKNLQFLSVNSLTSVIFNELIVRIGHGIAQLVTTRDKDDNTTVEYDIYSEAQPLAQLKQLSMNFHSVKQFEQLENSGVAANWKLEKFYFLYDKDADFVEWSRVFQMISGKWSRSMKNLVLQMPISNTDTDKDLCLVASLSSAALQLSCLQRVKLIVEVPCSLDFLLFSANTLECIEVIADYKEKTKRYYRSLKQRQQVKFLGFEKSKRRFTSNILEKFPKLKVLQIVTRLNQIVTEREAYCLKCWYRYCLYKEGVMRSEDRLEYPWEISMHGLLK